MDLQRKIELALERGILKGARENTKLLLQQEHKQEWDKARQAEYDALYKTLEVMHQAEYDELGNVTKESYVELLYQEDAPTYAEWINETKVVTPKVEEVSDIEVIDGIETKVEVTELVRPYTQLEVTDAMIDDKLNTFIDHKAEAQKYLYKTDWYVVRYSETGVEIPLEVRTKREETRNIL